MEIVDLIKLDKAIKYVQRIADGCNPVNNMPLEEDAVLSNPNVIRCMFFIKEVLEKVRHNDGVIASQTAKSTKEPFPFEILKEFQYHEDKSIAHLLMQIYAHAGESNYKKISPQTISNWLKKEGYLTVKYCQEVGKESTVPTEKGISLGIYSELRTYKMKTYLAVIYNRNAQEFLVKNLKAIVGGEDVK
jgi:hypothetical protein